MFYLKNKKVVEDPCFFRNYNQRKVILLTPRFFNNESESDKFTDADIIMTILQTQNNSLGWTLLGRAFRGLFFSCSTVFGTRIWEI